MPTRINQERVKILRLGKAWTQQKLADKAGISLRSMQRIESKGMASLQSRAAIAAAFQIEPTELEIGDYKHSSKLELIVILVLFTYSSFYIGLKIFDLPLNDLPLWAIPLFPSMTMLVFGLILQENSHSVRKTFLTVLGCVFLSMLLSPPDPLLQFGYTLTLWITLEMLKTGVAIIFRRVLVDSPLSP